MFTDFSLSKRDSFLVAPECLPEASEIRSFFEFKNDDIIFTCPWCNSEYSCIIQLQTSLFPLTCLLFPEFKSFHQKFEDVIIQSWDRVNSYIIVIPGESDSEIVISNLLDFFSNDNIYKFPKTDVCDFKIRFKKIEEPDAFMIYVIQPQNKYLSLSSPIPLPFYLDKGLSGLGLECTNCDRIIWSKNGSFLMMRPL